EKLLSQINHSLHLRNCPKVAEVRLMISTHHKNRQVNATPRNPLPRHCPNCCLAGLFQLDTWLESGWRLPLSRKCGMRNSERGIGKEKWQMTNGGWQMTNGGWQVTNGGWQMTNGGWQMPRRNGPLTFRACQKVDGPPPPSVHRRARAG